MRICLTASVMGAALVVASGASAQQEIRAGGSVRAELSSQDSKLEDGSYYRCYTLNTSANNSYVITLTSEDFDTYLSASAGNNCLDSDHGNDDGDDMGTNSQLNILSEGGIWTIKANTLNEGETGKFVLSVSRGETVRPTRDILPLTLGASVAGTLSMGDRRAEDSTFYDCYRLQMRSDDTVAIRMDSAEIDAYLMLHTGGECQGEALKSDDDSGGGTSAQIVERLKTGTYSIRANSLGTWATGAYDLSATVRR